MKRVPLTTAFASLLMVGAGGSVNKTLAHEADGATSADKGKNPARVEFGVMPGTNRTHFVGDLMVPLFQNGIDRSFGTNIKLMTNTQSQREGNFGLYYGQIVNNMLYRVYGFWDVRSQENQGQRNTFHQVTLGADVTTKSLYQVRANVYLPTTKKKELRRDIEPGVVGRQIGLTSRFDRVYQRPLYGADAEVGFKLPSTACNIDWRAYAGGFYFDASGADSVAGPRLRTEARIHNVVTQGDWVRLGLKADYATNVAYKKNQAPKDRFDVTFTVAYSVNLYNVFGYKARVAAPKTLYAEMNTPIVRDIDVVVQADKKKPIDRVMLAPAVDASGNPIVVTVVDNVKGKTSASGGTGAGNAPLDTIQEALSTSANKVGAVDNAIILVQGNGTDKPYTPGAIAALPADNMKLVGTGGDFVHAVKDLKTGVVSNAVIVRKGAVAQINHTAGDLITISDKNFTFHGFDIAASGAGSVVKTINTKDITQKFSSLNITGQNTNDFAFDVSNDAGTTTVAFDKVNVSGFAQNGKAGIFLAPTNAGNITATIDNSTITKNFDGVVVNNATGTSNVTFNNSTISENTDNGVQATYDGAGKANLTFNNTSVSKNTANNVDLLIDNGQVVKVVANNAHFDNSGAAGFSVDLRDDTSTFDIQTSGGTTFSNNTVQGLIIKNADASKATGTFKDTVFEGNTIGFSFDPIGTGAGTFTFGSGSKFINNKTSQVNIGDVNAAQTTTLTFEKGSSFQHTAGHGIAIATLPNQTVTVNLSGLTAVGNAAGNFIHYTGDNTGAGDDTLNLAFNAGNNVSGYGNIGVFTGESGAGGTVIKVTMDANNVLTATNGFDFTNGVNSLLTNDNFFFQNAPGGAVDGTTGVLPTVMKDILQANRIK